MNIVMIIPTGVGAKIGGNAGDANPVAKLLASCCDNLIVHPNVVNAADINEMTDNMWYVEGSQLNHFLRGHIRLHKRNTPNRILTIANPPLTEETINAVSAARATIGANIDILELSQPLIMNAHVGEIASGGIKGFPSLCADLNNQNYDIHYDALAVHTPIILDRNIALNYYRNGGINPWGGVEAILSKKIAAYTGKPTAHAPVEDVSAEQDTELFAIYKEHMNPRIAPEAISICYLHCVLKGLHRAPQLSKTEGLSHTDIDFMISPYKCWGEPHRACTISSIPIIFVKENTIATSINNTGPENNDNVIVENYLEAAGYIMARRAGVMPEATRADFPETKILRI